MPEYIKLLVHKIEHLRQGMTPYGLAPHKPILILALIDYLEIESLQKNEFPIDDQLHNLFKLNWHLLVTSKNSCDIVNPLFYLQSDRIWKLITNAEPKQLTGTKSFVKFQKMAAIGQMNNDLFDALRSPEIREVIRTTILSRYFPETEALYYQRYGVIPELISADEMILQEPTLGYGVKKVSVRMYEGFIRDQRFRRQVLNIYNHKCAMSGYSISGAPIIEACHINSHANEGDNRIQNGIALCRNLHTAFDYGLIGLDDQYRILVKSKKTFQESTEHYYALAGLKGKLMLLPNNKKYYPSLENLRQHREINGF